ncbi:MAG: hypothetical protein NZM04_06945 [Methylacidiphilales bacterium]|nr:hypothetical protein [Candidatus Methylacidiphilales bacterium]
MKNQTSTPTPTSSSTSHLPEKTRSPRQAIFKNNFILRLFSCLKRSDPYDQKPTLEKIVTDRYERFRQTA